MQDGLNTLMEFVTLALVFALAFAAFAMFGDAQANQNWYMWQHNQQQHLWNQQRMLQLQKQRMIQQQQAVPPAYYPQPLYQPQPQYQPQRRNVVPLYTAPGFYQ